MPPKKRPHWNQQQITNALKLITQRDGTNCWLCHHPTTPTTRSIDHAIPYRDRPNLDKQPTNWRIAHLNSAGTPRGCHTTGCNCPGNTGRRANPATPPPSRNW